MNSNAASNALGNVKVFRVVSYVLVFLMTLCVIIVIGGFLHNALPTWPSDIMVGVMLLLVIDRLYTYSHLKSLASFRQEWAVAFATQGVLFVIFIRLLV